MAMTIYQQKMNEYKKKMDEYKKQNREQDQGTTCTCYRCKNDFVMNYETCATYKHCYPICKTCYDLFYTYCDRCGELVDYDDYDTEMNMCKECLKKEPQESNKGETILKRFGATNIKKFYLVNNYGYTFDIDGKPGSIRFWANCYGTYLGIWDDANEEINKAFNKEIGASHNW